jgi:hypothetical protein
MTRLQIWMRDRRGATIHGAGHVVIGRRFAFQVFPCIFFVGPDPASPKKKGAVNGRQRQRGLRPSELTVFHNLISNVQIHSCIDEILRFWVDCEYRATGADNASTKSERIGRILSKFEKAGEAMRYLNADGRIAWKATPSLIGRLADDEREVNDDLDEEL